MSASKERQEAGEPAIDRRTIDAGIVLDVLCGTAERLATFDGIDTFIKATQPANVTGNAPHSFELFKALAADTCLLATQALHAVGGLPLWFIDEKTQQVSRAVGYQIENYSPVDDTWSICATQTGFPPIDGLPVLGVVATPPELREAYDKALEAARGDIGYFEPIHPRSP